MVTKSTNKPGRATRIAPPQGPVEDPGPTRIKPIDPTELVVRPADGYLLGDEDLPFVTDAVNNGLWWFGEPERKNKYTFVPLNPAFLSAREYGNDDPPARRLINSLALKLELLLAWDVGGHGAESRGATDLVPLAASTLLGLRAIQPDDPHGETSRRAVTRALAQLEREQLLAISKQGVRWDLRLLRTDGSGDPWRNEVKKRAGKIRYIALPTAVFRNGWSAVLSNAALYAALILQHQNGMQPGGRWPVQISEALVRSEYGIHPDTLRKGLRELEVWGLAVDGGYRQARVRAGKDGFATVSRWSLDRDYMGYATPLGKRFEMGPKWPPAESGAYATDAGKNIRDATKAVRAGTKK